jgi:RNA polymerase sigma-70 factor (ECF subfamily)
VRQLLNRLKSDESLMLAYRDGDAVAFEQLYGRHKDGLYAFLYRNCPRPAVVEELAQDTWMAVVNRAESYRPDARFRTWLYQIAHNRQVDFWRARDNRHASIEDTPAGCDAQAADLVPDSGLDDIMRAIGELPRDQKDALLLREQGFGLADISEITGAGEETVKSRLRYARKQLKTVLEVEV